MSRPARFHLNCRHLSVVLLGAALVMLVTVPVVSAHANLVDSNPSSGEQVEDPPEKLTLTYSEGVQLADVSVESVDGEQVAGEPSIDQNDRAIVYVPLDGIDNGTYVLQWEVLSVDGHTTSGSFFFVVGDEPPTREQLLSTYEEDEDEAAMPIAEPVFRSGFLVGTIILVGAPLTLLIAVYPAARRHGINVKVADRMTHWLFGGAVSGLLIATTGLAVLQFPAQQSVSVASLQQFFDTDLGRSLLLQFGTVLVLGIISIGYLKREDLVPRTWWFGGLVVGGLCLQLLSSWTSHSAAVVDTVVGGLTDFGHLIGAALWAGGLVALVTIVPTYLRESDSARSLAAEQIRRFSGLVIAGVAIAGATGLVIANWHVPGLESLSETRYGVSLSIKTMLVLVAIGVGGVNRFLLGRSLRSTEDRAGHSAPVWAGPGSLLRMVSERIDSSGGTVRTFVWSIRFELAVLIAVLLLSGVLTSIPTAGDVAMSDEQSTEQTFESDVDGVDLEVCVVPGHVGPNVFDVTLTRDGSPVETDEPVTLILRKPDDGVQLPEVELEQIDQGMHSTVEPFPSTGTWEIRVTTWLDGTYVSERYTMNVSSAEGGHEPSQGDSEYKTGDSRFQIALRFGAIGVMLIGIVAFGFELRRIRTWR